MSSKSEGKSQAFLSRRVVFSDRVSSAIVVVKDGLIEDIIEDPSEETILRQKKLHPGVEFEDLGDLVLMPGLVDSHVHVNEPGRTEWEGFDTATKAAAAGGVTTIADMPLNSIPPTTTMENLKTKARAASGKVFVDVAFWGGVIPGNEDELQGMVKAGVVGFKCFLCPSGVDEFPQANRATVTKALEKLKTTGAILAFHAEYMGDEAESKADDPMCYETFLRTRTPEMERAAIKMVCDWCKSTNVRCHIVHLSACQSLDLVKEARASGAPLTVETCYHYLVLSAEEVPEGATEFKCCPPIRGKANQEELWTALKDGLLDMVVSDHSPCVKELKAGDFLSAWGGVSSLQFGLPLLWTAAKERNIGLPTLSRLISATPAELIGLKSVKGTLCKSAVADFVIWDPEQEFKLETKDILYKNKLSPYKGRKLFGKVVGTVLRGQYIYKDGKLQDKPSGRLILKDSLLNQLD